MAGGALRLHERLEDCVERVGLDARAVVEHSEGKHVAAAALDFDHDWTAVTELDRVDEQVHQRLANAHKIGLHEVLRVGGRADPTRFDGESLELRLGSNNGARIGNDFADAHRLRLDAPLAGVGTDEFEEVVDERESVAGRSTDLADALSGGGWTAVANVEVEHLQRGIHRNQRRAEIVPEGLEEGRQSFRRAFSLGARLVKRATSGIELDVRRFEFSDGVRLRLQRG